MTSTLLVWAGGFLTGAGVWQIVVAWCDIRRLRRLEAERVRIAAGVAEALAEIECCDCCERPR